MYDYIRGRVADRDGAAIVLDAGGVGYRLICSATTQTRAPREGETKLYSHLVVREDKHDLYGFHDREERHLFRQLLAVSGVGPAVALALLSTYEPATLATHIAANDIKPLTRVKGVGKRTAERILVELRDKVAKGAPTAAKATHTGPRSDAVLAMCSLGLPRPEAERRVDAVPEHIATVEEIVKAALRVGP